MSKAHTSPTTRLLQGSRLFSLPRALPTPFGPSYRGSESATTPYPLRQTIETPQTSQSHGDWGLKRRLPKKNVKHTGTPTIRILAQDTSDHVTDFSSASDHERTLAKFQEMGIPFLQRNPQNKVLSSGSSSRFGKSVYEENTDSTDRVSDGTRWKQDGPWLGGMSEQELDEYLLQLRSRQPAWEKYVVDRYVQKTFDEAKSEALDTDGHFGPLKYQELKYRVAYVQRQVDAETDAARKQLTEEGVDKTEIDLRCVRVALESKKWIASQEDALRLQEDQDSAITVFTTTRQASARSLMIADQEMKRSKELMVDNDTIKEITARAKKMQNDANAQMASAIQLVIDLLDREYVGGSAEAKQQHATRLVQNAAIARRAELRRTDELQAQWAEKYRTSLRPSAEKVPDILKQLRDEHLDDRFGSELTELLVGFCDFAGMTAGEIRLIRTRAKKRAQSPGFRNILANGGLTDIAQSAPPSTHPGVGLGYIRSHAYMQNHPFYGPQSQHASIQARVLRPRTSALGNEARAKFGVGGFTAEDSRHTTYNSRILGSADADDPDRMAVHIDPYLVGGNKMWVHPTHANVLESGRVSLQVVRADKEAIAVHTGEVKDILNAKKAVITAQTPSGFSGAMPGKPSRVQAPAFTRQPDHQSLQRIQDFRSSLKNEMGAQPQA